MLFLVISFICVHWGKDTFLKSYLSSPVEAVLTGDTEVTVTGQVYQKEQASEYQIVYLKNTSIIYREQNVQEPYVMIYDRGEEKLRVGNIVKVSGRLSFFENERNPGGFSQKNYYRVKKIAAYLWSDRVECVKDEVFPVRDALDTLRRRWRKLLTEQAGEEDAGILSAMILGEKKQMDTEVKELYQTNGIAHILAISGLHLSFVGLGFYRFVRRATGSYPLGGIAGMSFLLLYILMIGTSVSAVRAVIMFCIRVGADMSGRVCDAPTSAAVAAVGVILWRPLSFYDAGFQLSFGAVGGIIFLQPLLAGRRNEKNGRKQRKGMLTDSLAASLSVQLVTLPVILYHYNEFPIYSVLLNLIVIPLMSVLLALGFLGSLLCLVWEPAGGLCLSICGGILKLYEILCAGASHLPLHRVVPGKPEIVGVAVYYLCLLVLGFAAYGKAQRKICLAAAAVGGLALALACPAVNYRGLEVTFLDVGQGDGIFIRERGGVTCLIDGGSSDTSGVGKYCIEPFLRARGVSSVDYAFVTHGDSDHISGLRELIERQNVGVEIGCIVFPDRRVWDANLEELCLLAQSREIRTATILPGQQITGKDLTIECLGPDGGELGETGNGASLILSASYGELDILFTGDVEGQGEMLLTETVQRQYEVLKVSHHGSRNSTGEDLLERILPKLAIISAGRDNQYGHPHSETLERLDHVGAVALSTADCGAIILKTSGKEVANLQIIQYNRVYEKFE